MRRITTAVIVTAVLTGCTHHNVAPPSSPTTRIEASSTPTPAAATSQAPNAAPSVAPAVAATSSAGRPKAYARITDAVITGPHTGAVLVSACRPAGHPCTFRVDTSTDGGVTWRRGQALGGQLTGAPLESQSVQQLAALDPLHLFAYADDFVSSGAWRSSDGGAGWQRLALPSSGYDLSAANGNVVEVARPTRLGNQDIGVFNVIDADGSIHRRSQFPVEGAFWTTDIVRTTTATLVGAGTRTTSWLMKSFDDGRTWTRLPGPPGCDPGFGQLMATDGTKLLLTCVRQGAATRLLRSDDGGVRWREHGALPQDSGLVGVASASLLWAVDQRNIRVSTDGGLHWRAAGPPAVVATDVDVEAFTARGTSAWYAVETDPNVNVTLHVTDDLGRHWRSVQVPS
jgi:hypothetical protein